MADRLIATKTIGDSTDYDKTVSGILRREEISVSFDRRRGSFPPSLLHRDWN
jgi:hypothetical protein